MDNGFRNFGCNKVTVEFRNLLKGSATNMENRRHLLVNISRSADALIPSSKYHPGFSKCPVSNVIQGWPSRKRYLS